MVRIFSGLLGGMGLALVLGGTLTPAIAQARPCGSTPCLFAKVLA